MPVRGETASIRIPKDVAERMAQVFHEQAKMLEVDAATFPSGAPREIRLRGAALRRKFATILRGETDANIQR